MSCQNLDLGLKCYLRTLDLQLYFVEKGLMRILDEKFKSKFP